MIPILVLGSDQSDNNGEKEEEKLGNWAPELAKPMRQ